ncbi:MAG: YkgJ family cysteine cluster protein [Planctomycetota bacterium]
MARSLPKVEDESPFDEPEPWYSAEGLRFGCTGCGKCCKGPEPGYVFVTPEEIAAIAETLGHTVEAFGKRFVRRVGDEVYSLTVKKNEDCVLWEEGTGCSVYEVRPSQCRSFPFWPEVIVDQESWDEYAEDCPGMGKGRLYDRETIERIRDGGATRRGPGWRPLDPACQDPAGQDPA